MKTSALFDKNEQMKEYQEEAKQQWGDTEAYKESERRVNNWTKEEKQRQMEFVINTNKALVDAMAFDPESNEAQVAIKKHYEWVGQFYTTTLEMYRGLGQMYVDDSRFAAYYDKLKPGLAVFVRDAIKVFCEKQSHQED